MHNNIDIDKLLKKTDQWDVIIQGIVLFWPVTDKQPKGSMRKIFNPARFFHLSRSSGKECPICGWTGQSFTRCPYPNKPADCLVCPSCGSFERHRFAYLALKDRLAGYAEKTLHIAPERYLEPWLRSISGEYISVDLSSGSAMEHMDITDLKLQDDRFSLVWCSHVLEHIENDRKALTELFRVLRPSGLAVILVPIYGAKTYEDPDIQSPEERLRHFKQEDHVRLYGLDIKNRLADVGFRVDVMQLSDISAKIVAKHALEYPSTKELFLCSKL